MDFTWVITLDSKKRLVLPLEARLRLGINGTIVASLEAGRLVIKPANENPYSLSLPQSRNCQQLVKKPAEVTSS
ncbi:hypothetical protein HYS54_05315 [Candidatus Micrarchaeota archaeon]|nr:hypothetical protein [Candidatus Micrarchaeota archaeon]